MSRAEGAGRGGEDEGTARDADRKAADGTSRGGTGQRAAGRRLARGFLKYCWVALTAAALIGAIVAFAVSGAASAAGVALGAAAVGLGFTGSAYAVSGAERIDVRLTLPVALITYAVKLVIFGAVLWWLSEAHSGLVLPFGTGVVMGAVVWLVTQSIWTYKVKLPYIELD
ncbi:hypothetical protein [Salininema proteolyticum]|uniref:ATP synthase protein I n=1 Tax=Salininema proteolyticum TaxID=1607685 RepID=A0ABV8TZ98_9ACTN